MGDIAANSPMFENRVKEWNEAEADFIDVLVSRAYYSCGLSEWLAGIPRGYLWRNPFHKAVFDVATRALTTYEKEGGQEGDALNGRLWNIFHEEGSALKGEAKAFFNDLATQERATTGNQLDARFGMRIVDKVCTFEGWRRFREQLVNAISLLDNGTTQDDALATLEGFQNVRGGSLRAVTFGELRKMSIPPNKKVLGDWLRERNFIQVFGHPGCGKSWFAASVAIALATGGTALGMWKSLADPMPVLFVDGEMPLDEEEGIQKRMLDLAKWQNADIGLVEKNIHVISWCMPMPNGEPPVPLELTDARQQAYICNLVKRKGIQAVILDNMTALFSLEDENAAPEIKKKVLPLIAKLKTLGALVLLLHHARKETSTNDTGIPVDRGSTAIKGSVDLQIAIVKPANKMPGTIDFEIHYTKVRNGGEYVPVRVNVGWDKHGEREWQHGTAMAGKTKEDIAKECLEQGLSKPEIVAKGISSRTVDNAIKSIKEKRKK